MSNIDFWLEFCFLLIVLFQGYFIYQLNKRLKEVEEKMEHINFLLDNKLDNCELKKFNEEV